MNASIDYERLGQFFGAYFHQDWDFDDGSTMEVVHRYRAEVADVRERRVLASQIRLLAESYPSAADLEQVLDRRLWCCYSPTLDGLSPHEWIREIAAELL